MSKKTNIITSKSSLYHQLNKLHFCKEVVLDEKDSKYIEKILRNINFKQQNIVKEIRNGKTILKKVNPINFNLYLKKSKR